MLDKKFIFYVIALNICFSSCAYLKEIKANKILKKDVDRELETKTSDSNRALKSYRLIDKAGSFTLIRESGQILQKKILVVKNKIIPIGVKQAKEVERSIAISEYGTLSKKIRILRPKRSQYKVWFNDRLYFSELNLDVKSKALEVRMKSPEKKWNGTQIVPFPPGTGVYCFYSQLIECVKVTGFLHKAYDKGVGAMNFHIIWDGYPYFQEQYENIEKSVFSAAQLIYDGKSSRGGIRFSLITSGQNIFYTVDRFFNLKSVHWVSQALSLELL